MTFGQIRLVKHALFALFVVCGGYVAYHVSQGFRSRGATAADVIDEPKDMTSREVELEQLDSEGRTMWTLKAAESVGRTESGQRFRDVEIRFDAGDDETPVVVTAEDCELGGNDTVHLRGNVVVRDESSLRLEADTLEFGRFPDRVWTEDPVRYTKKGLTGDAGNMRYVIKRGELDFGGGVRMNIRGKGAPVRITSRIAHLRRDRHWVQYADGVRARQGRRLLRAHDLQLFLDDANETLTRVEAYEKVDLRMRVTEPAASDGSPEENEDEDEDDIESGVSAGEEADTSQFALTSEPGLKRLVTDRLEMIFRPGGEELEIVRALEGGRLIMKLPAGATEGFDKELEGHTLAFEFDEAGELTTLRGRGGVELVLTPRGASEDGKKIVRARQLESEFDPETGELVIVRCNRAVEFEQGDVRASANRGVLHADTSRLVLTRSPRLWDPRAHVEAERIEIDVVSGDVEGIEDVRSSSLDESGGASLFPSADEEPVYFVADHLAFDRASEIAVYTGAARGFQGANRVEADVIRIHQKEGDLIAEGGVRTVFLQTLIDDDGEEQAPKPTTTRAATLHYRAEKELLEYRDNVEMRSEDMTLQGQSIDVALVEGGRGVREIFAVGEVEIETVDGKAAGDDAKYLPEDQSMTVTGEKAWLENAGKLTEGKQLTFFLTDDRILVDGQEQRRTKTTYSSKPRPF